MVRVNVTRSASVSMRGTNCTSVPVLYVCVGLLSEGPTKKQTTEEQAGRGEAS